MKTHLALRRQAMLEQAASLIDEVLAWEAAHPQAELIEVETHLQAMRQKFSQMLVNELIGVRAAAHSGQQVCCPDCGEPIRTKGAKRKTMQTLVGELNYTREYYHCASCQQGVFPPGPDVEDTQQELE